MKSLLTRSLVMTLLGFSVVFPTSCGEGTGQGGFCDSDSDCSGQLVCENNVCVEPQTGECDPPCDPAVEVCQNGTCVVVADANDKDRDGYQTAQDCDDFDRLINPGAHEYCDGVDNNCDGQIDEGCLECSDGDIRVCGSDLGACLEGSQECSHGVWSECSDTGPEPEACDGQDNDCDGLTDEVCPCSDGDEEPCSTDEGECVAGVQICTQGNWPGCLDGELPLAEICDNKDNDCDALTDEGFDVGLDCLGTGECGQGITECADEESVRCSTDLGGSQDASAVEQCNELDDDCDGEVDEDFGVGEVCDGIGECAEGLTECSALDAVRCSTEAGGSADQSAAESCNGLDDDCDGETDEDFPLGDSCPALGECGVGQLECGSDGQAMCSTHPGGSADESSLEECNELDDDCDGETDEGLSGVEECDGMDNDCDGQTDAQDDDLVLPLCPRQEGVCFGAVYQAVECESGSWTTACLTSDYGGEYEFQTETSCDDLDNDCDGFTDEEIAPQVCSITVDGVGTCGGYETCDGHGGWENCDAQIPTVEICDGQDNDCDGQTDEDFGCGAAQVGDSCDGEGACGVGTCECLGDHSGAMCSTDPGGSQDQSQLEQCNTVDDDCDGQLNEGFNLNSSCEGVGACGAGIIECASPTTTRCSTDLGGSSYQGTMEICDNADNDCDGEEDEGFLCGTVILGGTCDGVGACGMGTCECRGDGSGALCSTDVGGSQDDSSEETCNGQDDDCDGVADVDDQMQVLALCEDQDGVCDGALHSSNQCLGSTWEACGSSQYGPAYQQGSETACDFQDNNCNGQYDENWDVDGDGFTTCGSRVSNGGSTMPVFDCCDVDTDGTDNSLDYYPGNTQWFGGNYPCSSGWDQYDFNCDGTRQYQSNTAWECTLTGFNTCTHVSDGYINSRPECGHNFDMFTGCQYNTFMSACLPTGTYEELQRCH